MCNSTEPVVHLEALWVLSGGGGLIHPDTSFVSAPQLLSCTHITMHKCRQNVHMEGIFSAYSKQWQLSG